MHRLRYRDDSDITCHLIATQSVYADATWLGVSMVLIDELRDRTSTEAGEWLVRHACVDCLEAEFCAEPA